jgi:hypothetical protein
MAKKRAVSRNQSERMTRAERIDLARIRDMHPLLPPDMAESMVTQAALGLQRNHHSPGVELHMAIESEPLRCALTWPAADLGTLEQYDSRRITEDGAEAIALAVAHKTRAWRVIRRMQPGNYADWLLEHRDSGVKKLVAFEVGGTDHGSIEKCLGVELAQVAKSIDVDQRWAGVVGFRRPEAALRSVEADS